MSVALFHFRARTSDRTPRTARGSALLATLLAQRLAAEPVVVGEPREPRRAGFAEDLEACADDLADLSDALTPALERGDEIVIAAGDCPVCLGSLPAVAARRPDAKVLWLDAHGDLNLPSTTPSGFLGGMCLAGAIGGWDAALPTTVPEASVVLAGVRELDPGEQDYVAATAISVAPYGADLLRQTVSALDGAPVFVHLDADVLDDDLMPCEFPVPRGLTERQLADLLKAVAERSEVVGVELTAFGPPAEEAEARGLAELLVRCADPLLPT